MDASSRTIFALGSGCDGIEETCNWLKEEEEKKYSAERSLTLLRAQQHIPFSVFLLCPPPIKHVFFFLSALVVLSTGPLMHVLRFSVFLYILIKF